MHVTWSCQKSTYAVAEQGDRNWLKHTSSDGRQLLTRLVPYDPRFDKERTAELIGPWEGTSQPNTPTRINRDDMIKYFGSNVWHDTYQNFLVSPSIFSYKRNNRSSIKKNKAPANCPKHLADKVHRECMMKKPNKLTTKNQKNVEKLHEMMKDGVNFSKIAKETGFLYENIRYHYRSYHP